MHCFRILQWTTGLTSTATVIATRLENRKEDNLDKNTRQFLEISPFP